MPSPQEYNQKIAELGLGNWSVKVSSLSEAQNALLQIKTFDRTLRELRRSIKTDISTVWEQYREDTKASLKGNIGDSILAAFLGKKVANNTRKQRRQQQAENRDAAISAYRSIELHIDDLLKQLATFKVEVNAFILQSKRDNNSYERSPRQKKQQEPKSAIRYEEYIKSKQWREKAEEAKAKAGNRCQVCNRSRAEVQLDAHHRTYERLGNERPEDITVLCRECHQLYEDAKKATTLPTPEVPTNGFCIRCSATIKLNPQAPYCYSCFRTWKRFENMEYQENYCHICGNKQQATMHKPACYPCYKVHQEVLWFSDK